MGAVGAACAVDGVAPGGLEVVGGAVGGVRFLRGAMGCCTGQGRVSGSTRAGPPGLREGAAPIVLLVRDNARM